MHIENSWKTAPRGLSITQNLIITTLVFLSLYICSLALGNVFQICKVKAMAASYLIFFSSKLI